MEKVNVTAHVTTDLRDQLARRATEGDRWLSAEIRRALTAYLERDERGIVSDTDFSYGDVSYRAKQMAARERRRAQ